MSGFNPQQQQQQQQRMRMMYQQNQQQQQQQQMGGMNRMVGPQGGQQMMPNQGMSQQGMQGPGMRPVGNMNMRPQMAPQQMQMQQQQQQHQMMMQQQQQQSQPQMMHQQSLQSPQQPMSNQSQAPLTPMGPGDAPTPSSPSVGGPNTPSGGMPEQQQQPQQQQQQQQQQPQQPATPNTPQQPVQPKEINTVMVCRIGQEHVQEIISKTQDVFSYLRSFQPPYGSQIVDKTSYEKQQRIQEILGGITTHFKKLRVCFEKANEHTAGLEYVQLESLIPFKDEQGMKNEIEKKRGESYKMALDEHNELIQTLAAKNKHIKEIIDQMRNIIWEINTMLAMR